MQSNSATLSDAMSCWINLLQNLPDEIQKDAYFLKQLDLGATPLAACAYILDPRYRGKDLPSVYKNKGLKFLEQQHPFYVAYALSLLNGDVNYFYESALNEEVIKKMAPKNWWNTACKDTVDAKFIGLVEKIFTFPASTGGIERSFSTLGSIMTKQRNRLSIEKASKLCTVVNHYKLSYADNFEM